MNGGHQGGPAAITALRVSGSNDRRIPDSVESRSLMRRVGRDPKQVVLINNMRVS
jgi:hypothetical protein